MACAGGPTYFTTYTCAVIHYARSVACNQSQRGIASVAVRNRPADVDAGGSGAASSGLWAGPPKNAGGSRYRPCPSPAGDRNSALICIIYDFKLSITDIMYVPRQANGLKIKAGCKMSATRHHYHDQGKKCLQIHLLKPARVWADIATAEAPGNKQCQACGGCKRPSPRAAR